MRLPSLSLCTLAACALAGCQVGIPRYSVRVTPRLDEVRPPRSVLFARTALPLTSLQAALAQALPPGLGGRDTVPGVGWPVSYQLRPAPPRLVGTPGGLRLDVRADAAFDFAAPGLRCGGGGLAAILSLSARPALDPSGALRLTDGQTGVAFEGALRCSAGGGLLGQLGANALAQQADGLARDLTRRTLTPVGQGLLVAAQALRLPLAPLFQRGLDELARPISLTVAGRPACLDLDPDALVLAPLAAAGADAQALQLRVGVDAAPRLSLGPCPAATRREHPLQVREAPLGDEAQVTVAVAVPHTDVEALLRRALVGRTLGPAGQQVVVKELEVGDQESRLLLRLGVVGAFTGSLYLWGTPQAIQIAGRVKVTVPDLQVALETRDLLARLKLAAWELYDGGLAALLGRTLVLDVTEQLAAARGAFAAPLPLPSARLQVTVADVLPTQVASRPGLLVVHALVRGQATLTTQ